MMLKDRIAQFAPLIGLMVKCGYAVDANNP
jgi:hypothetical protein